MTSPFALFCCIAGQQVCKQLESLGAFVCSGSRQLSPASLKLCRYHPALKCAARRAAMWTCVATFVRVYMVCCTRFGSKRQIDAE